MLRLGVQLCARNLLTKIIQPPKINVAVIGAAETLPVKTTQFIRFTSFFNKIKADLLWKGVVSVSNPGKKRGRGKGTDRRIAKNLNLGQRIGIGKTRMIWPGLTSPVLKGSSVMQIAPISKPKEENEETVTPTTERQKRSFKVHPLDRGWTGKGVLGKHMGPPEVNKNEILHGFDSVVVENKMVATMTANLGRKRRFSSMVICGNKDGIIGIGRAKSLESRACLIKARNKSGKKLISINLVEKHTVNHDLFCQFGKTKIFVTKKPRGYGLVCHRVLKECCNLLGITDLHAKIEGPINILSIVKAFILGLLNMKSFQQIADENKLHVVEFRNEYLDYPKVLASPKEKCLSVREANSELVDFDHYIMGNRVKYERSKQVPFYEKLPSWEVYLKKSLYKRNHNQVIINLLAEYGELKCFLADRYPECKPQKQVKKEKSEE